MVGISLVLTKSMILVFGPSMSISMQPSSFQLMTILIFVPLWIIMLLLYCGVFKRGVDQNNVVPSKAVSASQQLQQQQQSHSAVSASPLASLPTTTATPLILSFPIVVATPLLVSHVPSSSPTLVDNNIYEYIGQ
jgi:hypothetical protein